MISPTIQRKVWAAGLLEPGYSIKGDDELDIELVWRALISPDELQPRQVQRDPYPVVDVRGSVAASESDDINNSKDKIPRVASSSEFPNPVKSMRQLQLGHLYLVFDFMDTDLSKIIRSNQYMTTGHVQFILYQILLGLKYVHSAHVIHRDLKPANILVSCVDCSVKIADFGLSRVVGPEVVAKQGGHHSHHSPDSPFVTRGKGSHSMSSNSLNKKADTNNNNEDDNDIDIDGEWQMEEVTMNEDAETDVGETETETEVHPAIASPLPGYNQIFNDPTSEEQHRRESQRDLDIFMGDTTEMTADNQDLPTAVSAVEEKERRRALAAEAEAAAERENGNRPTLQSSKRGLNRNIPMVPLKRALTKHVVRVFMVWFIFIKNSI